MTLGNTVTSFPLVLVEIYIYLVDLELMLITKRNCTIYTGQIFRAIFRKQFHETGQLLVPATDSMLSRVLIHVYNRVIVTSYCRVEFVVVGGDVERETKQPYKQDDADWEFQLDKEAGVGGVGGVSMVMHEESY